MVSLQSLKNTFSEILVNDEQGALQQANCEGVQRTSQCILRPLSEERLSAVVKFCYAENISYSVFSTGRNWGYGSSLSVGTSDVLLDLSGMDSISNFDEGLGLIELGPGVTQKKLSEFLQQKKSKWMLPTTGAGPGGSIIGNALEKGFGLNPIADHFLSLVSLRVLLPDGQIYQSRLSDMGAERSDLVSRWKVGSCFEALFAQSNLGIVTKATIELAAKPEQVVLFIVKARSEQMSTLVEFVQSIRAKFQGQLGGINISNKERLLSTIGEAHKSPQPSQFKMLFEKLAGLEFYDHQAIFPVFIHDPSQLPILKAVKKMARLQGLKVVALPEKKIRILYGLIQKLQWPFLSQAMHRLSEALELIKLVTGEPTPFTLKVAYSENSVLNQRNHPAQDGVGLFWFAPILPLRAEDLVRVEEICRKVAAKHQMRHLFTFTNFDQKLVEATIPLYFTKGDETSRQKALACWDDLFEACLAQGYAPYRYSILHMQKAQFHTPHLQELQAGIKKVFDPKNLFAKGRY